MRAGYEPGKKYPMLVYFYERMSDTHHNFSFLVYDDRPHMSTYASNGYLVLGAPAPLWMTELVSASGPRPAARR